MSLRPHLRRVVTLCVCRYWVVTRLVTGCVRARPCVRATCVRLLDAAWGVTNCRIILSFARVCRIGVWFGFVGSALLLAVGTCVALSCEAMRGLCSFLRVTHLLRWSDELTPQIPDTISYHNSVASSCLGRWQQHRHVHVRTIQLFHCNPPLYVCTSVRLYGGMLRCTA